MKIIFALTLFLFSMSGFADEVILSSQEPTASLRLEDDEYKDIFEDRLVTEYCERRVLNNSCYYDAQTGMTCRSGGASCTTDAGLDYESCYDNLRYECQVQRSVFVRREFVKKHVHQVEIKLDKSLELGAAKLNLNLTAKLEQVAVKLTSSYTKDLIQYDITRSGDVTSILIKPIMSGAAAEQFRVAGIQDLSLSSSGISLVIKDAAVLKEFIRVSSVQIEKNRIFNDKIIYSTAKESEEGGEYLVLGKDLVVTYTCKNSKIPCLKNGKYNLFVTVSVLLSEKVLNLNDFSYLKKKMEAEIIKARI